MQQLITGLLISFLENRDVYEMWKNTVERDRPQMTVWFMGIACWIPKATNTHGLHITYGPTTTNSNATTTFLR